MTHINYMDFHLTVIIGPNCETINFTASVYVFKITLPNNIFDLVI